MKKKEELLVYQNAQEIAKFFDKSNFHLYDFFKACPYSPDILKKKNRKTDLKNWRFVGMTISVLCGKNTLETENIFKRNHATVLHAIRKIKEDLHFYKQNSIYVPYFLKIFNVDDTSKVDLTIDDVQYCIGFFHKSFVDFGNNIYYINLSVTLDPIDLFVQLSQFFYQSNQIKMDVEKLKSHTYQIIEFINKTSN
jgi:hypothetical protein